MRDGSLGGRLERPLAPIAVQANHYSIEVQWEHIRLQDQKRPEHRRLFDEAGATTPGSLIYLHRRDKKSGSIWESVYWYVCLAVRRLPQRFSSFYRCSGSAMFCKAENLKPNTQYEFRVQYKLGVNGGERSDWSPVLQAATTPEPMTGDTIYRAIGMPGKDHLEKLLAVM